MNNFEELERLYVPSYHTKRFESREQLLAHFTNFSKEESYKNRMTYECHLNIDYGTNKREKLDIYGEHLPSNSPILIFIHGGYWVHIDKEDCAFIVAPFVDNGIRVIIVDHSICVPLESIVDEIKKCFMWIADYINKNEIKKISVVGHCAGAFLLLPFALSEDFFEKLSNEVAVDAFFLSGIFYLDELRFFEETNRSNVLRLNDDNVKELSPLYKEYDFLTDYNFTAHIYVGAHESEIFKRHSLLFAEGPMSSFLKNFKQLECDHFSMIEYLSRDEFELTRSILGVFQK